MLRKYQKYDEKMKIPLKTFSRALFIWTILLVVILGSFVFVMLLTRGKSRAIRENIRELQKDMNGYQKIDTCISLLYVAENNSRLFIITQDSAYLRAFTNQLTTVSNILTRFERDQSDEPVLPGLIRDKQESSGEFIRMKMMVDSLFTLSMQPELFEKDEIPKHRSRTAKVKKTAQVDSVYVVDSKKKKKGLFKRLAEAIKNKENEENAVAREKTITETESVETSPLLSPEGAPGRYELYEQARKQLNQAEQRLLFLNGKIFNNLQGMLKNLKAEEERKVMVFRKTLLEETSHQFEEVSHLMWGGALVVLVMTVIIIRNLVKLYRNDVTILQYAALTSEAARKKGEFLAQITHEVRTPLNAIIGFSQLMDTGKLEGQMKESVEAIHSSSRLLLGLVNDILDFSKLEQGKLTLQYRPFSPVAVLNEVTGLLTVLADEKHISITPRFDVDSSIYLHGDDFRIKQVVINLLNNAIKFTPVNGSIVVEAKLERIDQQTRMLRFSIKDSGIGIAPQHLKVIFEDFSQVGEIAAKQGTGLGLAICKRIVALHGGTISVESAIGKGSEFKVAIPMTLAEKVQLPITRVDQPAALPTDFSGKRALVADDTRLNLVLISRFLEKYGIEYDLTTSGDDALEMFEKQDYDLVVTDIHMPGMDGTELTRRIRAHAEARKAATPVVGFTGDLSDRDKHYYAGLGINGVLGKPFSESELLLLLGQVFYPSGYPEGNLAGL